MADSQNELKVLGTPESVNMENNAEMIATRSNESNDNNHKSKKRFQILMSRGYTEQDWNTCTENLENKSCTHDTDLKMKLSTKDSTNKKIENNTEEIKNNERFEENFLEKQRFEEIEDKLEEMFAGIEDEQLLTTTADKTILKNKCDSFNSTDSNVMGLDNSKKYDNFISLTSSYPTKAAKKSNTLSGNENTKEFELKMEDQMYLKTMSTHRRHSIEMNGESIKCSVEANGELKDRSSKINKNMSSHLMESQTYKQSKNIRGDIRKNKFKSNNERCSEYKKEVTYNKSSKCKKTKVRKTGAYNKTKQNQQGIKRRRMQHLFSSENDNDFEERPLQNRDIESKHRSPFILINKNGSITVVNTVAVDDSNEKWTKSKKINNYVYERKSFKGCHSSTLSNRYDADTADSSWICVFCKIGPHKKGLGDLFGPYIISSDCDEYRYTKNHTEIFKKGKKGGAPFLNLSNKSIKYMNESLTADIYNTSDCNEERWINSYFLGMSQISDDCYEIWVHDECALWAPNIFVVGSRLTGLEDVTWDSMRYECKYCLKNGALLCCLQRGCNTTSHVPCAREHNWLLDETKFWVYCCKHV